MSEGKQPHVYSGATPGEVSREVEILVRFEEKGLPLEELSRLIDRHLVPNLMNYDLPVFQSLFNAFPEEGALLGGRVALRYNQGVTNWQVSPGGTMLEEMCGRALCRLFGLAGTADATFMYCGTYANQQAVYMALHRFAERCGFSLAEQGIAGFGDPSRLAVLASANAHFSLRHAVRMLGLGERSLIAVPVDRDQKMNIEHLCNLAAKLKATRDIFCITLTAGTTTSGSVDPILPALPVAGELGSWLHVDGAYGLAYSLVPECRALFAGIERADSVCWDPHKQMGVPIPNSVLFVRDRNDFGRMSVHSSYFNRPDDPEPNPGMKSAPSTRPLAALPLVASIRHQGLAGVVERLRAPLAAVRALYEKIKRDPEIELGPEPDTGILCFRVIPQVQPAGRKPAEGETSGANAENEFEDMPEGFSEKDLERLQQLVYQKIKAEGRRSISTTRLDGRTVLRLVANSPRVTAEALLESVADIKAAGRAAAAAL